MTSEQKDFLYTFVDLGYSIENLIRENERLEEENTKLREENKKRFDMIMGMSKRSQESVTDFIKMLMKGDISINNNNKEE